MQPASMRSEEWNDQIGISKGKTNKELLNKLGDRQRPFPRLMASANRMGLEGFKGLRLTVKAV